MKRNKDVSGNLLVTDTENGTLTITTADVPENFFTAPQGKEDLTATGTAHELVDAGESDNGSFLYSLDGETWSEKLPVGTDEGTYTVFWK